ncbi:MAG: hypothetical protein M3044_01385 [Thermoproteota archaeon]|nr:hypothetical protein [Thermoproteota archaeon]
MTKAQKEQYVIELYKQDKTTREIAERAHMSPRDIAVIIRKVKAEVEREAGHTDEEEIDDNEHRSKQSQAFKLFSEGKTPVDVVVTLDLPADEVRAIYRDYWALNDMHELVEVYDQTSLPSLLKLYRIVNAEGMGEQEIINILKLANNNELPYLQERTDYLRDQINILELEKAKCTNHVLILSKRIDELSETVNVYESSLEEKREEVARLNQEEKRLENLATNNIGNKNEQDVEIFYASGRWQFPEKLE